MNKKINIILVVLVGAIFTFSILSEMRYNKVIKEAKEINLNLEKQYKTIKAERDNLEKPLIELSKATERRHELINNNLIQDNLIKEAIEKKDANNILKDEVEILIRCLRKKSYEQLDCKDENVLKDFS